MALAARVVTTGEKEWIVLPFGCSPRTTYQQAEPATLVLIGGGLAGLRVRKRRPAGI
jgi:hypothetical protein